jgi:hypothetical protein
MAPATFRRRRDQPQLTFAFSESRQWRAKSRREAFFLGERERVKEGLERGGRSRRRPGSAERPWEAAGATADRNWVSTVFHIGMCICKLTSCEKARPDFQSAFSTAGP